MYMSEDERELQDWMNSMRTARQRDERAAKAQQGVRALLAAKEPALSAVLQDQPCGPNCKLNEHEDEDA
jgi:hypothetical protein